MAYRVETAAVTAPDTFTQDGPECRHFSAACELAEALLGDHRLAAVRVRDLSRDPAVKDPIVVGIYNLQWRRWPRA